MSFFIRDTFYRYAATDANSLHMNGNIVVSQRSYNIAYTKPNPVIAEGEWIDISLSNEYDTKLVQELISREDYPQKTNYEFLKEYVKLYNKKL